VVARGELVVAKSKTDAGAGRKIPLTKRACGALTLWLSRLPEAETDSFVFPSHQIGLAGDARDPLIYGIATTERVGHTFITRLLESPNNSEETVRALAGHVSRKMMEHYSHIRQRAKEAAIAGLENCDGIVEAARDGAQNWAQSGAKESPEVGKVLDFIGATRRIRTDDLLITNCNPSPKRRD
jgi:hypothetical protein